MKTSTIPSIRVKPELRAEIESLLSEDESMSEFVETSVRESVLRRKTQAEFIAKGLASLAYAKKTDDYVDADVVIGKLQQKLDIAKAKRATGKR